MPQSMERQKRRKTLRQALRDLWRRQKKTASSDPTVEVTFGSGILKKVSSVPQLPNLSTVSVFPSIDKIHDKSSRHSSSISRPPTTYGTLSGRSSSKEQTSRLLPQPSLASFGIFPQQCDSSRPREVVLRSVPEPYQRGASREASIVSAVDLSGLKHVPYRSSSSLRIRESKPDIGHAFATQTKNGSTSYKITSSLRRPNSVVSRQPTSEGVSTPPTPPSTPSRTPPRQSRPAIERVEHFRCFCILDTGQTGCPVTGTSKDLRYIFEIGEKFVLNNRECEGSSMDMIAGIDAAGEEIVYLVLFAPLITPSTGRSRFMLVSLIDVTDFIRDSANQVPELDTISEEASVTEEIATPPPLSRQETPLWSRSNYDLSADDLLGGCSIAGKAHRIRSSIGGADDDIWLALAESEGGLKSNKLRSHAPNVLSGTTTAARAPSSHASETTDDILKVFMTDLQRLYSDFFVLGQSPLVDNEYEMCNVSPNVYATGKEWIDGHLSHTPVEVIRELSERLAQSEPFSLKVRWGTMGQPKQLYCSPLYAAGSITWICYLVGEQMSILW